MPRTLGSEIHTWLEALIELVEVLLLLLNVFSQAIVKLTHKDWDRGII
jgi:hypothetical protein